MSDKRSHRGPAPGDVDLFGPTAFSLLCQAVSDMNWLLTRGYAEKSGLKLVGDRYCLTERQRIAIMRSACSDQQYRRRTASESTPQDLPDNPVIVDGYNVLITTEAALSGAVLLKGTDNCIRDLSGIHGTYHRVQETLPALDRIAQTFKHLRISDVLWLLDSPVSNSGRLKQLILDHSARENLLWQVELSQCPDKLLIDSDKIVITSDSAVLDRCRRWFNFMPSLLSTLTDSAKTPWLINLSHRV
jgi:hypothetical protein